MLAIRNTSNILRESSKIEKLIQTLEEDFNMLGIYDEAIRRSIALELDVFSNLIIDTFHKSKAKNNYSISSIKRDNIDVYGKQ